MPRAVHPADPRDEIAARRAWAGPTLANGALTADLAAFCQRGLSVVLASRGGDGRPIAGRAVACIIDAGGRVRLLLRRPPNAALLEALGRGAGIAATFTQPTTHRSIQLKAPRAELAPSAAGDGAAAEAQAAGFRAELIDVGYGAAFATHFAAFDRAELAAVEFLPDEAFVQTPGPSAGSALGP